MNHEIHEAHEKAETLADIRKEVEGRFRKLCIEHVNGIGHLQAMQEFNHVFDRIEAAWRREANSIERLVRDAIIDYQEMFAHAPNDDAERDLIDRAERGNAWLVANGYEPEQLSWSKEVSPCL